MWRPFKSDANGKTLSSSLLPPFRSPTKSTSRQTIMQNSEGYQLVNSLQIAKRESHDSQSELCLAVFRFMIVRRELSSSPFHQLFSDYWNTQKTEPPSGRAGTMAFNKFDNLPISRLNEGYNEWAPSWAPTGNFLSTMLRMWFGTKPFWCSAVNAKGKNERRMAPN